MKVRKSFYVTSGLFLAFTIISHAAEPSPNTTLWYQSPAKNWNEALPIGNGRLGAMIFGDPQNERIQLNKDSLWSAAPQDADNPKALEALPEIRKLLFDGKYEQAEKLANTTLICRGPGSG